ncbi:Hypothetical_protein [Hexamita inflata]|uniref:Hypothetical_protein n=1 Tax=Hexamita inflata TaxID=28002 RepID=A0AA86PJB9_9EUKA|nr:Hypothetical protein HINF_LOCUS24024 [Hexamita inflata]
MQDLLVTVKSCMIAQKGSKQWCYYTYINYRTKFEQLEQNIQHLIGVQASQYIVDQFLNEQSMANIKQIHSKIGGLYNENVNSQDKLVETFTEFLTQVQTIINNIFTTHIGYQLLQRVYHKDETVQKYVKAKFMLDSEQVQNLLKQFKIQPTYRQNKQTRNLEVELLCFESKKCVKQEYKDVNISITTDQVPLINQQLESYLCKQNIMLKSNLNAVTQTDSYNNIVGGYLNLLLKYFGHETQALKPLQKQVLSTEIQIGKFSVQLKQFVECLAIQPKTSQVQESDSVVLAYLIKFYGGVFEYHQFFSLNLSQFQIDQIQKLNKIINWFIFDFQNFNITKLDQIAFPQRCLNSYTPVTQTNNAINIDWETSNIEDGQQSLTSSNSEYSSDTDNIKTELKEGGSRNDNYQTTFKPFLTQHIVQVNAVSYHVDHIYPSKYNSPPVLANFILLPADLNLLKSDNIDHSDSIILLIEATQFIFQQSFMAKIQKQFKDNKIKIGRSFYVIGSLKLVFYQYYDIQEVMAAARQLYNSVKSMKGLGKKYKSDLLIAIKKYIE